MKVSHSHGKIEVQLGVLKFKSDLLDEISELCSSPTQTCGERPKTQRFEEVTDNADSISTDSGLCRICMGQSAVCTIPCRNLLDALPSLSYPPTSTADVDGTTNASEQYAPGCQPPMGNLW
jgi:hypothetical protein